MSKPLLLDLFCGAGGAAMGYHRAGFDVVGVDHKPQPRYPFEFIQADAMTFPLEGFDVIHASPPCQAYSKATAWRGDRSKHPDLIGRVQRRLRGYRYVIENVQEARFHLVEPLMLCGSMFGLPIRRHRYFELSPSLSVLLWPCVHRRSDLSHDHGRKQTERQYRQALGCDWMTVRESREAIPPAYTDHIGQQLMRAL